MKKALIIFIICCLQFMLTNPDDSCSILNIGHCNEYIPPEGDDGKTQCLPVGSDGKCSLKNCESLSIQDCDKFVPIGEGDNMERCLLIDSKCQLKKCSDIYDCIRNEENTGCELKVCSQMKPNECLDFRVDLDEYRCLKTKDGKGCELKKCSDYEPPNCDKYLPKSSKKCVQDGNKCVEKSCEDFQPPNCRQYFPKNFLLKCDTDPNNENKCKETIKDCEDLHYNYCYKYNDYYHYTIDSECVKKVDKNECQLALCENMPINECEKFIPLSNNEKCILNSDIQKCEIITCSGYDIEKCNEFIPNDKAYKCTKSNSRCYLEKKACDEMPANECQYFDNYSDYQKSCLPDENNNKCKLYSCEELNPNECNKFTNDWNINSNFQCISINNKCKLISCSDLSVNECNIFKKEDSFLECIKEDDHCRLSDKKCEDLPIKYCGEDIRFWELCFLNEKGNKCKILGEEDDDDNNLENEGSDKNPNNNNGIILKISFISLNLLLLLI